MGLDISLYRIQQYIPGRPINEDSFNIFVLDRHPELNIFKKYSFEKDNEYFDLSIPLKELGYSENEVECVCVSYAEATEFTFKSPNGAKFTIFNPPIKIRKELCILAKEVGYQRKGANYLFYEEDMWDSAAIVSKEVLIEHWKKYFSFRTPDSKGGWGSSVEYNLTDDEMCSNFKKNIVDKFVENKTFVIYH